MLDPWNGSGTTTYTAAKLGLSSAGYDINPVMVVIARARMLSRDDVDSLRPLLDVIISKVGWRGSELAPDDPLTQWFADDAARHIRAVEASARMHLVGERTLTPHGSSIGNLSSVAATFYVALFAVCRKLTSVFRASNPTWTRIPKNPEERIRVSRSQFQGALRDYISSLVQAAVARDANSHCRTSVRLDVVDTTRSLLSPGSTDFVLTSPPYCTRIDYAAATRVELAVLDPLCSVLPEELSRQMIGTTRVPKQKIEPVSSWGKACETFLARVASHHSKASSGYYTRTHLDYFNKLAASITGIQKALRPCGKAVFVVQDSFYKDVHNDVPLILTQMAEARGLALRRREDFRVTRSMVTINSRSQAYRKTRDAIEAVLCFENQ